MRSSLFTESRTTSSFRCCAMREKVAQQIRAIRNAEFGVRNELGVRSAELVRSAGSDERLNAEGRGGNRAGRAKIRDVRVRGTSAVFITACMMAVTPARADDVREVLARVREYVSWYDRQLVTLIADE